ncbi:MAG: PEGA domain-containing protein, partial [Verrucomicrobiia bacterium]
YAAAVAALLVAGAIGFILGTWKGAELQQGLMQTLNQERSRLTAVTDQVTKLQEELNNLRLQAQAAVNEAKLAASKLTEKEKELQRFDGVRGGITINTSPQGAIVRVGGDAVMTTPATFEGLLSQTYPVEIELPGYDPVKMEVEVSPQAFTNLGTITLSRQLGTLLLESNPPGAHFEIVGPDFSKTDKTPAELTNIPTGTYQLRLSQPDYPVLVREVVVEKGPPQTVSWAFGQGKLIVKTEPEGADVLLDGKNVGKSPISLALKSGSYTVGIKFAPWEAQEKMIVVTKDETTDVSFELTMAQAEIKTSQPGVAIWCGDTFLGRTPLTAEIPVGRHTVWAVSPGAKPQSATIELAQGEIKNIQFAALEALPLAKAEGAPQEQYLEIYLRAQEGDKLAQEGKAFEAYLVLQEVLERVFHFRKDFPDFETAVVMNRERSVRARLEALETGQALTRTTLRPSPQLPEITLPQIETDPPD